MVWITACVSCSGNVPLQSQEHHIRLAQVWRPPFWETVGALNRQGPITVALWEDERFERQGLNITPWISPVIVDALRLTRYRGLQGQALLKSQEVSLDGLQTSLYIDLSVLSETQLKALPARLDAIIPLTMLVDLLKLKGQALSVKQSGMLSSARAQEAIKGPSKGSAHIARDDLRHVPHLTRFKRWSPHDAYESVIVGARVDHQGQILIKWLRPRTRLPKDLWLLVNIAPRESTPQALGAWMIPRSSSVELIPRSTISTMRVEAGEEHLPETQQLRPRQTIKEMPQCTYAQPCPVTLIDVVRRLTTCHHDLCVYTPQAPHHIETR